MIEPLHVLLVGPPVGEAPLVAALQRVGFAPRVRLASSPEALAVALAERQWDAAVVEGGAGLSVLDAVAWVRRKQARVPVVVLRADPAEAVALVRAGAADLLGEDELDRLGPVLARALPDRPPAEPGATFHALAAHMPIGLYRSTADGRILYANPALAAILGYGAVEEVLGTDIRRCGYPRERFEAAARTGDPTFAFAVSWTRADGRTLHTQEHVRAVRDANGLLLYYEGTIEDITTEREALLRERRRAVQLEALVRYGGSVDSATDLDRLYAATVEAASAVLGVPAVLLKATPSGLRLADWSPELSAAAVRACEGSLVAGLSTDALVGGMPVGPVTCPALAEHGYPTAEPIPLIHRGRAVGVLVALLRKGQELTDADARMAEALGWHAAGALARHEAERAVRASEGSLRSIARATGHVLYRRRFGSTTYDYISDSVLSLTGYSADELNTAGGLLPLLAQTEGATGEGLPEGRPSASGDPYLALHRLRRRDGELRWVEDRAYPWVVEGETVGLVGVLEDVTERRWRAAAEESRAQRALEQQRALLELSSLELGLSALVGRLTEVAARVTGTARASVWTLGGTPDPEGDRTLHCRALYLLDAGCHGTESPLFPRELGNGRRALQAHRVYANGDLRVSGTGSAFLDEYYAERDIQAVLIATVRRRGRVIGFFALEHAGTPRVWAPEEEEFARALADLVALAWERDCRAAAEAALRASEARYRAISEMASDYAFAVRFDAAGQGRLEWATRAFERITGYDPETFASTEELIQRVVYPDDVPLIRAADERLAAGEPVRLTLRMVTREGLIRWVHHRARPVLDEYGALVGIYAAGQDVSERVHAEAALQEARDRAEAARVAAETMARHKGDLLASMSHEIRTPLTGIIGFAEVLAEEVPDEHREFAGLIATAGKRLLETLNSVLELARLESGRLACEPAPLDVAKEVLQVADLLRPLADAKGLDLRVEADDAVPALLDRACLARVLTNLIGNAVKFTDEGHVTVSLRAGGGTLTLTVSDSGVGIDAAFLPHVFEEFRQEGRDPERRGAGSGLGLAITRRLVRLMGGEVAVDSVKGEGTTFTVTLPHVLPPLLEPDAPLLAALFDGDEEGAALPPPPDAGGAASYTVRPFLREDLSPEDAWVSLGWADRPLGGDGSPNPPPPAAPPLRALVVEDNDETRHLLERVLHPHCAVETVRDARSALERMACTPFDVLVLDIHLGGRQTGADVLRVARTLPGYASVAAVAVTAYALPGDREAFLRDGFDAYLSKPFTASGLLDALRAAGVPV